jgi:hypothetical protein
MPVLAVVPFYIKNFYMCFWHEYEIYDSLLEVPQLQRVKKALERL